MRLYLDQMIGIDVAEALRNDGHDVVRNADAGLSRADDAQILQRAIGDDRVLVTLDQDFGDWAILPLERHRGVIRVRVRPATSQRIVDVLLPFLKAHAGRSYRNYLVIVSWQKCRWIHTAE